MKYSRVELKELIKECLVEILSEGLGGQLVESQQRRVAPTLRPFTPNPNPRNNLVIPDPIARDPRRSSMTIALKEAVKSEAKGSALMGDLLADTAMTTLQNQLSADQRSPVSQVGNDVASQVVAQHNPEELFGEEVASKWADLAFASPGPKLAPRS